MALTTNDYLIKLFFERQGIGDEKLNTFFYRALNPAATAGDLWDAFEDKIMLPLREVVANTVEFTRAEIFNLVDPSDFFSTAVSLGLGTRAGGICNSWQCWAFRLNRALSTRRNGRKAIGIPADDDIINGAASTELGNDIVTKLNALETALSSQIFLGGGLSGYQLCIPHSVEVIDMEHPDGHYVLDSLDDALSVSYVRVSTQNSRKDF